jgi:hypothetical protein
VLGFQLRLTVCCTVETPVPVRDSAAFEALLAKERVAEAVPLLCGVKVIEYDRLCPAAMVVGSDIPLSENSELLLLAEVIVTLAPPAVNLPVCEAVDPTVTLPNDALLGETLSWPEVVPVPLSGTQANIEFLGFMNCNMPVTDPEVWGENKTLKVTLCPEVSVIGKANP